MIGDVHLGHDLPRLRSSPPFDVPLGHTTSSSLPTVNMVGFREQVLSTCWLITALATFYFWLVVLSIFGASRSSEPSSSPIPAPAKCDPEAIKKTMDIWISWMTILVVFSVSILFYVRKVVDAAAAAETKGDSFEEAYKLARDELKEAIKAVDDALTASTSDSRDEYVNAIGERNMAIAKVARTKPKEGLARLPIGRQRRARVFFFLALLSSFAAGVCASVAFYLSLRLLVRCNDNGATISPFVVVSLIFLSVHLRAVWVAFTED